MIGSAVFWPKSGSPDAAIADGSEHRVVWVYSAR